MNNSLAISISSNALVLIGANPISSFTDNDAGAIVAKSFYEPTIRAILQSYPWTFAKKKVKLNKLTQEPLNDYKYMYQIPSDSLKILYVNDNSDYDIYEDKILSDAEDAELDYLYRVDESYWTPLFREYVELYLASKFAVPVTQNASNLTNYANMAENIRQKAKYDDAQSKPNKAAKAIGSIAYRARRPLAGIRRY